MISIDWASAGVAFTGAVGVLGGIGKIYADGIKERLDHCEGEKKDLTAKVDLLNVVVRSMNIEKHGGVFPTWVVEKGILIHINDAMVLFISRIGLTPEDVLGHRFEDIWSTEASKQLNNLLVLAKARPNRVVTERMRLRPGLPECIVGKMLTLIVNEGRTTSAVSGVLISIEE
jgi:hypothetical protein